MPANERSAVAPTLSAHPLLVAIVAAERAGRAPYRHRDFLREAYA